MAENWDMPAVLLILICVLNDAATLVISVDNTQISTKPDKWRLGQLMLLSVLLAMCLAALSFAHFFVARDVFNVTPDELHTIMYLHISSAPHFVIFSTRVPGYCWQNLPSWIFAACIIGTQIVALFFSVYGVFGSGADVAPIGYGWGFAVLGISLVYFLFLDIIKVQVFKIWNFELTAKLFPTPARKAKLAARKADAVQRHRVLNNWKKAQRVAKMSGVILAMQTAVDAKKKPNTA